MIQIESDENDLDLMLESCSSLPSRPIELSSFLACVTCLHVQPEPLIQRQALSSGAYFLLDASFSFLEPMDPTFMPHI